MKKIMILVGFLLLPAISFGSIDISLKYGMSGQPVMELQDLLVSEGCLSVSPTGYFGLLTLQGVKCFQAKHGIEATGYFGVLSRTEANRIITNTITGSDEAENTETGAVSSLVSCKAGDLFDANTGKPCSKTTEAIQNITEKIDALNVKVDTIKTNTDPVVGAVPEVNKVSPTSITYVRVNTGYTEDEENENQNNFFLQVKDAPVGYRDFTVKVQPFLGKNFDDGLGEEIKEDSREENCGLSYADKIPRCSYTLLYKNVPEIDGVFVKYASYFTLNGKTTLLIGQNQESFDYKDKDFVQGE